jgi:hypothetical protein
MTASQTANGLRFIPLKKLRSLCGLIMQGKLWWILYQRVVNELAYRGPGILATIWFGSFFPPSSPVSKLNRWHIGRLRKRDNLLGKGGGRGMSQLILRRESLVLYNPLTDLWFFVLQLWLWEGVLLAQGFHRACQSSHRGETLSGGTK